MLPFKLSKSRSCATISTSNDLVKFEPQRIHGVNIKNRLSQRSFGSSDLQLAKML